MRYVGMRYDRRTQPWADHVDGVGQNPRTSLIDSMNDAARLSGANDKRLHSVALPNCVAMSNVNQNLSLPKDLRIPSPKTRSATECTATKKKPIPPSRWRLSDMVWSRLQQDHRMELIDRIKDALLTRTRRPQPRHHPVDPIQSGDPVNNQTKPPPPKDLRIVSLKRLGRQNAPRRRSSDRPDPPI